MIDSRKLHDLIIIGATPESYYVARQVKAQKPDASIILASTDFNQVPDFSHDVCDSWTTSIVFLEYFRGMIKVYDARGGVVCGRNLLISTGSTPLIERDFLNDRILEIAKFNDHDKVRKSKNNLVIISERTQAVSMAIRLSKYYKHIYICSPNLTIKYGNKLAEKVKECKNIEVFGNCRVIDYTEKNGQLQSVKLDTYTNIKCNKVIVVGARRPAIPFGWRNLCTLNQKGAIVVNNIGRMEKFKNMYAIGACASQYHADLIPELVDDIIKNCKQ